MAWGDFTNPDAWKSAMANLLRRGGEVTDYIQQAPGKAGQAILDAGQRQQALMNEAFDPTGKTLIRNPQAANQAAMNLLEGPLGFMPAGITAWHGSPHTFEAFDVTKGGTGQGTQNYGHGTYFAENPTIAEGYMGRTVIQEPKLERFTFNGPDYTIANGQYLKSGKPISEEEYKKAFSGINQLWNTQNKGSLYKVDIPDESIPKMLDWYEQVPESVKKKISEKAMDKWGSGVTDTSGEKLYKEIVFNFKQQGSKTPQADASKWLSEQGIPGIKYENFQIKKGQGANTSNYVVFDPTDVKILERNNQPLTRKEILEEGFSKPVGMTKLIGPQSEAMEIAQKNASLPVSQGGLGLPPNNTAMDRAKALGYETPVYHGTNADINAFNVEGKGKTSGAGAFFTTNPTTAETYVSASGDGNILPLLMKKDDFLTANAKGRNWADIWTDQLAAKSKGKKYSLDDLSLDKHSATSTDELGMIAKELGLKGTHIKNVKDLGPNSHVMRAKEYLLEKYGIVPDATWSNVTGKQFDEAQKAMKKFYESQKGDIYAIQDPSLIRSKFAAFDPKRINEADILAGVAPLGLLTDEDTRKEILQKLFDKQDTKK